MRQPQNTLRISACTVQATMVTCPLEQKRSSSHPSAQPSPYAYPRPYPNTLNHEAQKGRDSTTPQAVGWPGAGLHPTLLRVSQYIGHGKLGFHVVEGSNALMPWQTQRREMSFRPNENKSTLFGSWRYRLR